MDVIYEPSKICMIRTPLLSLNYFYNYLNKENINYEYLVSDSLVKESILTTTVNLYNSLHNVYSNSKNKKNRDTKESLLKYLIRMSIRPTPFGLLSGINIGEFKKENTQIKLGNNAQKYVKIDGEWLYKLISYIESTYSLYKDLKVIWNDCCHIVNDRIYLYEQTAVYLNNNESGSFSIKNSCILSYIKYTVENKDISFARLVEEISVEFDIKDQEQIKKYIHTLITKEVIYSDVRPPLSNENNFQYILDKLCFCNEEFKKKLESINSSIIAYEECEIGDGSELYLNIIKDMEALFPCRNYLQIDTKVDFVTNVLNENISKRISEAAYLLWLLSKNNIGSRNLKNFQKQFLEHYGFEQLVNVKDLISEIKGFGSLIYTEGEGQGNNIDFLKQKYLKALKTNGEVEINDIDFQKLIKENKVNEYHAPISSDIYSELYIGKFFNSYSELIVISPITTSSNAGATFGRFHHLIDLKYLLELEREKRYYYEKFMENDDIEMVSINELPKYPRHQNVLFNNDSFDYIVNLGTNCSKRAKDLSLDELYVGATINKLYLYSSSLNKRVLFESNNMFNFFKSSNLYRFLKEVSMESVKIIEPLNEFSIDAFSYLPRIRYKNVVLRLASWKINSSVLALPQSDEWDNLFLEYKKEFDIPNMVNLIYGDNKLLLNLELSSHRYLLMKEYKKNKRVRLVETFVPNSSNEYTYEIVTPIYKKRNFSGPKIEIPKNKNKDIQYDRNWLSIHIYINREFQDEFIVQYLNPLMEKNKYNKLLDSYFIIRYIDDKDFLKLRIYRYNEDYKELFDNLNKWFTNVKMYTEVSSFEFVEFIPEYYRYGGENAIYAIEEFFDYDTGVAVNIIRDQFEFEKEYITAISIIYLFEKANITNYEREDIVDNYVSTSYRTKEIRIIKNELVRMCNPKNNFEYLRNEYKDIFSAFDDKNNVLTLLEGSLSKPLTAKRERIVGSLIHMRCNRIFGINKEKEKFVLSIVKEIIKTQKHWSGEKND